ncbi:hypothetical protein [Bacillus arachidis]|uniref:hypothetical protein n=1 Tax=Bacillus arachidis TaxID=2819290 RepID=UPI001AA0159B|nr:hypothetical protein [Bacillus arachidis]
MLINTGASPKRITTKIFNPYYNLVSKYKLHVFTLEYQLDQRSELELNGGGVILNNGGSVFGGGLILGDESVIGNDSLQGQGVVFPKVK